jgi:hypothetical protein
MTSPGSQNASGLPRFRQVQSSHTWFLLQPADLPALCPWARWGSNPRPSDYEAEATGPGGAFQSADLRVHGRYVRRVGSFPGIALEFDSCVSTRLVSDSTRHCRGLLSAEVPPDTLSTPAGHRCFRHVGGAPVADHRPYQALGRADMICAGSRLRIARRMSPGGYCSPRGVTVHLGGATRTLAPRGPALGEFRDVATH